MIKLEELVGKPITEEQFDESTGKKDVCYRKRSKCTMKLEELVS